MEISTEAKKHVSKLQCVRNGMCRVIGPSREGSLVKREKELAEKNITRSLG